MSEATILSKLSLKGMKAQPAKNSVEAGKDVVIAAIYGSAHKHELVNTTFGDSVRFIGSFEGVNAATGEIFKAGKAFLPTVVEELLADAINSLDGNGSVEFAFEIGATHSEKGNTGYAYTVKPLTKLAESDALLALREKVVTALKALPAPDTATHPVDKPSKKK